MTTAEFRSIPIDKIEIRRDERQRRELTGIAELAESLNRLGQIHPILIDRDHVLIAGERRLTAAKHNGWTHISAQFSDEVEPHVLKELELEENIRRVDISWQDQCRAIEEYHRLRSENNPDWNLTETAKSLNISPQDVSHKVDVAKALAQGNERVAAAPKFSVAKGIVTRDNERRASGALNALKEQIGTPKEASPIVTADFTEWAPAYTGDKFNLIHCDFPYGINMQDSGQSSNKALGDYEDGEAVYWSLLESFAANLDNFCAPSAHLMFWFSMKFYTPTLEFFRDRTDFKINPVPMVWTKSDNVGILADASRGPRNILEFCLLGSRGDRKVVQAVANGIASPTIRERHMSEKPQPVVAHYFRMLVDNSSSVLDPTCGSGSAIRAAKAAGAAHVLGLEKNESFANIARSLL